VGALIRESRIADRTESGQAGKRAIASVAATSRFQILDSSFLDSFRRSSRQSSTPIFPKQDKRCNERQNADE
jgi:hypothetical protein